MARAGLTPARPAQAGAELADEIGLAEVTVSAVARRFDVKVASLYSHVLGSQDLRNRIALFALQELADRVAEALAGPQAPQPEIRGHRHNPWSTP